MRRIVNEILLDSIEKSLEHKNVIIVEGARQVGKTYLVEDVLSVVKEKPLFRFNLEKEVVFREEIDSCRDFAEFEILLKKYGFKSEIPSVLFIDEAQESENLGGFIRFFKENWTDQTVILSGSSMTRIFRNARVPVGRLEYLRVTPYNFREFLRALNKESLIENINASKIPSFLHNTLLNLFDEYLSVGGLPQVVNSYVESVTEQERQSILSEIIFSQQDDFIRKEFVTKSHLFKDALRAAASLLGLQFSLSSITNNHRDAQNVLSMLNSWHILNICEQHGFNTTSKKHPKVYVYDIGVAKKFREDVLPKLSVINTVSPLIRTALGGLLENIVYLELISGKGFLNDICGWVLDRNKTQEVDFIYDFDGRKIPIEVKANLNVSQKMADGPFKYLSLTSQEVGVLISGSEYKVLEKDHKKVFCIPFYLTDLCNLKKILS